MCAPHSPRPDATAVQDLQLDDQAKGVLALVRHFMTSFADPSSQAWQMAFATAQERWGGDEGPHMAMACLGVVQALRRIRATTFRFSNPLCPSCRQYMTADEAEMMAMLQAMRRDRTTISRTHLARLTGGRLDPAVITHGLSLARRMGPALQTRPSLTCKSSGSPTPLMPSDAPTDAAPRPTHHGLALLQ